VARRPSLDRGRRQGAKWCYVRPDNLIVDYKLAKEHGAIPKDWIRFQSQREAKRFIYLKGEQEFGNIRNLRTQLDCPLYAIRPDGLKEKICVLRVDFCYDRPIKRNAGGNLRNGVSGFGARPIGTGRPAGGATEPNAPYGWEEVHEDTKGWRQDAYILKKKWFEAQYGKQLEES